MKTDDYTEGLAAAWGGQPQSFTGKSAEYYEGYLVGWDLRRLPVKVSEEKLAGNCAKYWAQAYGTARGS